MKGATGEGASTAKVLVSLRYTPGLMHLGTEASEGLSSSSLLHPTASSISVSSSSTSGSCSAAATAAESTGGTRRGSRGMTAGPSAFRTAARVARALARRAQELSKTCVVQGSLL